MEDGYSGVRFSSSQNTAQIESLNDFKKEDCVKSFKEMELSRFYVLTSLLSIVTFVLDLYFHCWIAYVYYVEKEVIFFYLTLVFIVVPALVSTAFSMRWYLHIDQTRPFSLIAHSFPGFFILNLLRYLQDEDEPSMKRQPLWKWGIRVIMLVLQLAPLLRYYDTLAHGVLSQIHKRKGNHLNQQKYLRMMLEEETNASLLRLLWCFLMSAPQAIIQLVFLLSQYVKLSNNVVISVKETLLGYQLWAILCSIVSISWALTAYHRSVRLARDDKENLSVVSALLMFCWNVFSTSSRVLALSLLATLYPAWFATICLAHWLVMALWIDMVHHRTAICGTRCEEVIFNVALGLAYVISFISPKDGPTRYSYLAYYLVCFMENTAALVVWCVAGSSTKNPALHYRVVAVQMCSFVLGVFFMISYYKCYHPSGTSAVIRKSVNITQPQYGKR